jgi:hypothetical protein
MYPLTVVRPKNTPNIYIESVHVHSGNIWRTIVRIWTDYDYMEVVRHWRVVSKKAVELQWHCCTRLQLVDDSLEPDNDHRAAKITRAILNDMTCDDLELQ